MAERPGSRNLVAPQTGPVPARGVATLDTGAQVSKCRLDSIVNILRDQGISEEVTEFAKQPQRDTTTKVYDKQWSFFVKFCQEKDWSPFSITVSQLGEYLLHLFNRGLAHSTINTHKAAISSVLTHLGANLAECTVIRNLMKRIEIERPRQERIIPRYDIALVLKQFMKPPFIDERGSDMDVPLDIFVCKVTFLLALATGARRSELHALSRTHKFNLECKNSGLQTLTLHTQTGFLAKTDRPGASRAPIIIPSMSHMVGQREPERLLCPVLAVTKYLARTPNGQWSSQDERLLRHPNCKRKTTKGNVSMWIRSAVVLTHEAAGQSPADGTRPHEVRAIASSLLASAGATMDEVLEGGRWRSKNTFFNHYLREMGDTLQRIGAPVVAAGKVLSV